jgi:hypothetical protein
MDLTERETQGECVSFWRILRCRVGKTQKKKRLPTVQRPEQAVNGRKKIRRTG